MDEFEWLCIGLSAGFGWPEAPNPSSYLFYVTNESGVDWNRTKSCTLIYSTACLPDVGLLQPYICLDLDRLRNSNRTSVKELVKDSVIGVCVCVSDGVCSSGFGSEIIPMFSA